MRKDSPYYLPSINVLQSATLFHGVDAEMMEDILGHFTPMTLPKKSIIHSSQTKESFFVIISGRVTISQINLETGREYIIYILEGGDAFDIISLLDREEHEVVIEAIDELQLLKTSILIMMPMIFLSGAWTPVYAMHPVLEALSYISPLRYYIEGSQSIFFRGTDIFDLWPYFLGVISIGGILFWLGVRKIGKLF